MEDNSPNNPLPKNSSSALNHQETLEKYNINKKSALITIMLCIFIDVLGYSMIMPLLPIVATRDFGASNFMVGILIASNALAAFIFAPIWGKISDKIGRKFPLILSQLGTLAAFLILGFSDSIYIIFISRILDGIFGGQIPIIRAYITDVTDAKSRTTEMGRFTAGMAFGMMFGPAIGGLIGVINWRYPAFIASILSITSIILVLKFLVESMPKERIVEIKQRRSNYNKTNKVGKSAVLTQVVVIRLIETLLIAIAFGVIFSTFALVMDLRYGLDIAMIGIFSTFAGVLMIVIGSFLMKPLNKKFGEKTMLLFVIGVGIATFLSYPLLTEAWLLFIYVIPFTFMNIFTRTIIMSNLTKAVEEDQQGLVSGLTSNMFSISQITAPLIGYWYLEIGTLTIIEWTFDAYFLMGMTCAFTIVVLLVFIIIDMQKFPEHFKREEIVDFRHSS